MTTEYKMVGWHHRLDGHEFEHDKASNLHGVHHPGMAGPILTGRSGKYLSRSTAG